MATTQQQPNTACVNMSSRRVFAPYFRARWQNMQNFVNDSVFFSQIPPRWLNYYNTYVRQWLEWSRGFVPQLHRQDFFSTGMGYTICDIFARECMSGGWRLDCKDDTTAAFLEEWGNKRLATLLHRMFFFANAGGNALIVATPVNGDIFPSILPKDRFIFDIGRNGNITFALLYNRFSSGRDAFYAMETRMTVDGKSYYKVELQKGDQLILNPNFQKGQGLPTVPEEAQAQWEYNYGDIEPSKWYELPPAIGIGLYNVQNKSVSASVADIAGYADSTLHTALDILYSIDFNYTSQQLDMYWGKTRVLLSKEMQPRTVQTSIDGKSFIPYEARPIDSFAGSAPLDSDFYNKVVDNNSVDGKPIQPEFIQPDLRGEAHKYIRDADLELLASKVGLSSSTLANHLQYNNPKTATQVVAEEDTTAVSVNNKRNLAGVAINKLMQDVCAFYGLKGDDAHIVWNKYGVNSPQENQELLAEYTAGLLPKREFVKRRYPDLTDKQVDEWLAELEAETPQMEKDYNLGGF